MAKPNKQTTTIPRVPIQTPMWEDPDAGTPWPWNLSRTWIIFFERIWKGNTAEGTPGTKGAMGPFHRTLLLKDTTKGDDIADHTTVYTPGTAIKLTGVLRKPITSALTVTCVIYRKASRAESAPPGALISLTIPPSQGVDNPLEGTDFTSSGDPVLAENDVLSWNVNDSDGQTDAWGVAAFTLTWQPK